MKGIGVTFASTVISGVCTDNTVPVSVYSIDSMARAIFFSRRGDQVALLTVPMGLSPLKTGQRFSLFDKL